MKKVWLLNSFCCQKVKMIAFLANDLFPCISVAKNVIKNVLFVFFFLKKQTIPEYGKN